MWQRGKRHIVQVYGKWKVAPAEKAGSSSAKERVETDGDTAAACTASKSTAGHEHVGPFQSSQKSVEVYNNSEAGDPYFKQSPLMSDTSVRKRPRKVVSSYGCLLCFGVMCPILLITAAVIIKSACNRLRDEHENRVPATCRLTQVQEMVNQTTWCECGYCKGRNNHQWLCLSSYPCYVINVTYVTGDFTGTAGLSGINSSTPCSIDLVKDCYIEPEMNRKLVEEQVVVLQEMSPAVECVHDKENSWNAHLAKDYKIVTYTSVVHCYFWPAVLIALSLCWMLAVGYDTITTARASYTYATWRNMQSPTYITPSVSDESYYDGTQAPASWLGRLRHFLQDQIKEQDEMTAKRAKLLSEMRTKSVMLTESGMIFYRPGHTGATLKTAMRTPSRIIQGILEKDAEGVLKRAKLDEPFVESDMTTELDGNAIMENESVITEVGYSDWTRGEVITEPEHTDSVFETNDVLSVTSFP